nr:hypothetical protein [Tanacetum cinerariifolium]
KLTVNGNETVGFDKSNVECYNCHKRGYFARECRAPRNQDNKNKESTKKSLPMETSASTTMVSCDGLGGYDWSDQAEEGSNYALMAFSSSSSNSEDQGVINSRCSRHMTGNMSYLTDYEEIDRGYVAFRGNPERGKITRKDFELIDESEVLLRVPRKNNMYSVDLKNIVPEGGLTCLFEKATSNESKPWHRRLARTPQQNRVAKRRNRTLIEAGSGSYWLFDIDVLTRTINYEPIVHGTQSNGFAGRLKKRCMYVYQQDLKIYTFLIEYTKLKKHCMDYIKLLELVYVDDIIFVSMKKELCNAFGRLMHEKFQMSSMGKHTFFLGLQPLLKEEDGEEVDVHMYRSMIGSLMYLTSSRPDIIFTVTQPSGPIESVVDDVVHKELGDSLELCNAFGRLMHEKFQMSSMGERTFFLGLQVKQKKDHTFISQDKYVATILKKFGFIEVNTASTPMETQKPLLKEEDGEEVDVHMYRSMIGSVMYLTSSRPDIMFAVCAYTRYQVNPNISHLHAMKRIFKYLKGQPKLGIWYPKDSPFDLVAYIDSDYARASLDKRSTT